jgi:hypothetical protein
MVKLTLKLNKKQAKFFYHHLKVEHPKYSKKLKVVK